MATTGSVASAPSTKVSTAKLGHPLRAVTEVTEVTLGASVPHTRPHMLLWGVASWVRDICGPRRLHDCISAPAQVALSRHSGSFQVL